MRLRMERKKRIPIELMLVSLAYLTAAVLYPDRADAPAARSTDEWVQRVALLNARAANEAADLVFLGDSISARWETVPRIWERSYGRRKAMNLGVAGDCTQHVLWRLDHGHLDGLARHPPRLIVLMIGTNNSKWIRNSPAEIARGINEIVTRLRTRLPATKVLLLSILPCNTPGDGRRINNAEASRLASRLADGRNVVYLDINAAFLAADGTLLPGVIPDGRHPSARGYELWAKAIEPTVERLWGD